MMNITAHLFGPDHIWIFVVPALGALFLLRWAEKRARANADSREEKGSTDVD